MGPDEHAHDGQDAGKNGGYLQRVQAAWKKISGDHSGQNRSNCTAWQN